MVTKRKNQPRGLTTDEVETEIHSRMNISPDVIRKIAMEANLEAYREELVAFIPQLATAYQQDKMYEVMRRDGSLKAKAAESDEDWRSFMPPLQEGQKRLPNKPGHDALLALYDSLWVWWEEKQHEEIANRVPNSERKFKYSWNEMKFDYDSFRKKTAAADERSILFLLIAQALDGEVAPSHCSSVWDRARKRAWRSTNDAQEIEQQLTAMTLKVDVTPVQSRPNPPGAKKGG